jgi:hypothetical protein
MRGRALAVMVLAAGCAKPGATVGPSGSPDLAQHPHDGGAHADGGTHADGGGSDGSVASDAAMPDLGAADLLGADLSQTPDLAFVCDTVKQMGCNAGQKCTVTPMGYACEANGTKTTGQACGTGTSDDCVAGDLCSIDSNSAVTSICRQFCATDGDCKQSAVASGTTAEPGNVAHCIIGYSNTSAMTCTFACNPVTKAGANGCPTGLACVYGGTMTIPELTDCLTPGSGLDGTSCMDSSTCAPGFACVGSGMMGACRQVCRNARPGDCSTGGYACLPPAGTTSPMFGFCCPTLGC